MAKKIENVVIIGGTGFVGNSLVTQLTAAGVKVSVVHRDPLGEVPPSSALYYRVDAASPAIESIIAGHDAVAILIPPKEKTVRSIVDAAKRAGVAHILYASTTLLYKDGSTPQKENAPLQAVNDYERAKLAEEKIVAAAAKKNTKVTLARLGSVYGDVLNKGIVGRAFHALMRKEALPMRGGDSVRDYIYIDDVAHALSELVRKPGEKAVEIINVSTGIGTKTRDLITQIERIAGTKILLKEEKSVGAESPRVIANNSKLIRRVGKPKYDLKKGLAHTHERFRAWYDSHTI